MTPDNKSDSACNCPKNDFGFRCREESYGTCYTYPIKATLEVSDSDDFRSEMSA